MKTLAGFPPRQDPGWGADQVQQGLALVGDERVHVDQGLDVGVAGGGVGGDESAVGVPDQDDGPGNGRQKVRQIGGVVGDAAQRVGRGVHGEAVLLQLPDDLAPAGSVRPGAVLQHDDGLGPTVPAGDVLSAGARGGGLGGGGQQAGHRKDRGDDDEAQPGRPCCTGEVHAFPFSSGSPTLRGYECRPRLRLRQVTAVQHQLTCRVRAATGYRVVPWLGAGAVAPSVMVWSSTCRSSDRDVMPSLGKTRYR